MVFARMGELSHTKIGEKLRDERGKNFQAEKTVTSRPEKPLSAKQTLFGFNAQGELQAIEPSRGNSLDKKTRTLMVWKNGDRVALKIPLEVLKLQLEATDDPTNRIKAALAAYQELNLTEPLSYSEDEQLWALDSKLILENARHLHEIYRSFHKHKLGWTNLMRETYLPEPSGILPKLSRKFKQILNPSENPQQFDILNTKFDKLPPYWQEVNFNSSRNILMIFQQFAAAGEFDNYEQDIDLGKDEEMIFKINSALFAVWSTAGETLQDGKARNPLFANRTYQNFREISRAGTPSEGWDAFLVKYKKFVLDNSDTYAFSTDFDRNENGQIEVTELEGPEAQAKLKTIIIEEATRELVKDAHMMIVLVEEMKVVTLAAKDRQKRLATAN